MLATINTEIVVVFFSVCFIVGSEQNGLDFNRQVRLSLDSPAFLDRCFCCSSR